MLSCGDTSNSAELHQAAELCERLPSDRRRVQFEWLAGKFDGGVIERGWLMMVRAINGGILGGIVVFIWGAIAHMALPLGEMGIRELPGEDKIVGPMKDAIKEPGFYFFPGLDRNKATEAEQKAWEEKIKQGPTGVLIIQPQGGEAMSPRQLATEFGANVVAALLAAAVLTQVRSNYIGRVLVVTLMGVFGFVSIVVSYWNWYGFPTDFAIAEAIMEIVGWLLAGLVMAAIVRPLKAPEKV
jgi:hypothetical protein